ncbi:MAG: hypothetical protein ABGZ17_08280, partial [Planctomycetaceae bacterium]
TEGQLCPTAKPVRDSATLEVEPSSVWLGAADCGRFWLVDIAPLNTVKHTSSSGTNKSGPRRDWQHTPLVLQ